MIQLPEKFKLKIINRYNKKGKDWLDNINNIIEKYKNKFELENITLIEDLSINLIISAKSKKYGDVVIKIGSPGKTSISEINLMKQYPKNHIPLCYYFNLKDKVMIQQKLIPGYSLQKLNSKEERIKVFCTLVNHLIVVNNHKKCFQTYEDIMKEKVEYVYQNKQVYFNIIEMVDKANNMYQDIKKMNLPKYILHNDLHHRNILKSDNSWKIIDPHGIIGEKVFETSAFIRFELENFDTNIQELTVLIEKYLKQDKKLILQALYINIIIKIIWYTKDKYDNKKILYNINVAKEVLRLIEI